MYIWALIKNADFANPATPLGATAYAMVFATIAWVSARMVRAAVERALAQDRVIPASTGRPLVAIRN